MPSVDHIDGEIIYSLFKEENGLFLLQVSIANCHGIYGVTNEVFGIIFIFKSIFYLKIY
jgi:hypothetical protein